MKVSVTVGSGSCNHLTFATDDGRKVQCTLAELQDYDRDEWPRWFSRVIEFVRRYRQANPGATWAQIRTAVQAEDF